MNTSNLTNSKKELSTMNKTSPEPVNKEVIHNILAEFKDDIEEWEFNIEGSPSPQDLTELEAIYDDANTKLDTEYFKNEVIA